MVYVLNLAVECYSNLTGGDKWHTPAKHRAATAAGVTPLEGNCWNCGKKGCRPKTFDKPFDQAQVKKSREQWLAQRESAGGQQGRGRGQGRGDQQGRGSQQGRGTGRGNGGRYSRDKWGPPTEANEVCWEGNKPHAYCAQKTAGAKCGWNCTHNTAFHQLAMGDGYSMAPLAQIAPSHYLVEALKGSTPAPATLTPDMVTVGGGGGDNRAKLKKQYLGLAVTDGE